METRYACVPHIRDVSDAIDGRISTDQWLALSASVNRWAHEDEDEAIRLCSSVDSMKIESDIR